MLVHGVEGLRCLQLAAHGDKFPAPRCCNKYATGTQDTMYLFNPSSVHIFGKMRKHRQGIHEIERPVIEGCRLKRVDLPEIAPSERLLAELNHLRDWIDSPELRRINVFEEESDHAAPPDSEVQDVTTC